MKKKYVLMSLCMVMVILVISASPVLANVASNGDGQDHYLDVVEKGIKDLWHWLTS